MSPVVTSAKSNNCTACTVVGIIAGSLLVGKCLFNMYNMNVAADSKVKFIELTDLEKSMYFNDIPPISTITWFKGDFRQAKAHLKIRLKLFISKNPWLQGRLFLKYGRNSRLFLSYSLDDETLENLLFTVDADNSPVTRNTPLAKMNGRVRYLMMKTGKNEPIFRLTIIPCKENPNTSFAVMLQLSHIVGDGATYYKLMSMLMSTDEENIVPLNAARNMRSGEQQIAAMGNEEGRILESSGYHLNILKGVLQSAFSSSPLIPRFAIVDQSKIEEIKVTAAKESGLPFVSSNDVITSWFLQQTKAKIGLMAINWRNRLDGHTETQAGNYENVLLYRRADSMTPDLIRRSLKTFRRVVTADVKVPGFFELLSMKEIALVTNWASFAAKKNEIEGCIEDYHIPLYSFPLFPKTMPLLLIYRAKIDRLGLCYFQMDGTNLLDHAPFLSNEYIQ